MRQKSEVAELDVLMINETKHTDMLDIMAAMQDYLDEKCPFRWSLLDMRATGWKTGTTNTAQKGSSRGGGYCLRAANK